MSDIKRKVLLGYPPITQSYIGRFFKYIYSLLNKSKNKSIIIINLIDFPTKIIIFSGHDTNILDIFILFQNIFSLI